MALLTYDGTAQDHETIPQVLHIGKRDGKPLKRKVKTPARTVFRNLDAFDLWGMVFPKDTPLLVTDKDAIRKAANLTCFSVEIEAGEPITFDKEWMTEAQQNERVKVVDKIGKADRPGTAAHAAPVLAVDSYDTMKRTELIQLARSRELSVNLAMSKAQIIVALREGDAAVTAEIALEGGDVDISSMQDAG